jgi:hypothetical protein
MDDAPNAHLAKGYKRRCLYNILKYLKENNYIKGDFDVYDSNPSRRNYMNKDFLEENMKGIEYVEHKYLQNFKIILDEHNPFNFDYPNPIKVYFKNFFCDIELDIITTETPSNNSVIFQNFVLKDPPEYLQVWEPTIGSRCSLYHLLKYLIYCNNINDLFLFEIKDANVSEFGQRHEIESIRNKEIKAVIENLAINASGIKCPNPNTQERLKRAKEDRGARGGMKIIKSSRKKKNHPEKRNYLKPIKKECLKIKIYS